MNRGDIVFLSASVPHREGWKEGSHPAEIEEAIVSLARAVFSRGGRLLFGGHPSVSFLIASVAGEYFEQDPSRTIRPVITFQSELFREFLPDETWLLYRMGWSSIEWTEKQYVRGEEDLGASLRLMRERMLLMRGVPDEVRKRSEWTPPKAMVAIGGMEGVIEEAEMFLNVPGSPNIYTLPSGGGAAARLHKGDHPPLEPVREVALDHARRTGRVIDLEQLWRERYPTALPKTVPFKPYASILQFMLDELVLG